MIPWGDAGFPSSAEGRKIGHVRSGLADMDAASRKAFRVVFASGQTLIDGKYRPRSTGTFFFAMRTENFANYMAASWPRENQRDAVSSLPYPRRRNHYVRVLGHDEANSQCRRTRTRQGTSSWSLHTTSNKRTAKCDCTWDTAIAAQVVRLSYISSLPHLTNFRNHFFVHFHLRLAVQKSPQV